MTPYKVANSKEKSQWMTKEWDQWPLKNHEIQQAPKITCSFFSLKINVNLNELFYNNHSFSFFKFCKFGLCYSHTISVLPFSTFITTDHLLIQVMGKRTNASRTSLHAPISRLVRFLNSVNQIYGFCDESCGNVGHRIMNSW